MGRRTGFLRRLGDASGLCLAELVVTLAAGVVVLAATLQALDHFQVRFKKQQEVIAWQQDLRLGAHVLGEELRLAGTGALPEEPTLLRAAAQDIEFYANLEGLRTTLTQAVSSAETELMVLDGSDWRRGKRVIVCDHDRCAAGYLDRDGQRSRLMLKAGLGQTFPAGSEIVVSNRVRYYVGTTTKGLPRLMRDADGGANPIVGHVTGFRMRYVDKDGQPSLVPAVAVRVQVELVVGDGARPYVTEVGLRRR